MMCLDVVLGQVICPAGDSSSCAMVVMRTGAFIVFCPSDESPPTFIHSPTNTFSKVSLVGIQFTYYRLSETLFFFPGALKCWCGTIATMFSQDPRRDSKTPLLFFPRGCIFSMTPCHSVRVTSTSGLRMVGGPKAATRKAATQQNRARPTLATTAFGQQLFLVWPRPVLATVSSTLATVNCGIFEGEEG